jgi:hypothetical protein
MADLAARHSTITAEAMAVGGVFMVEIVFDDGEHVRWGTDQAAMVDPQEVGALGDMPRFIEKLRGWEDDT